MFKLTFLRTSGCFCAHFRNRFEAQQIRLPTCPFFSLTRTLVSNSKLDFLLDEVAEIQSSKPTKEFCQTESGIKESPQSGESVFQISHPWHEWVDLMEFLLKNGYFEAGENPFQNGDLGSKELNVIRTACLNFGRDQYNLIRFLSRNDVKLIASSGCPSLDRKVVNSAKRLRAHVGIDEGNVCSVCSLRGDCERAFVMAREDEGGRTVDVMRILLMHGLDHISHTVENKQCLHKKVKESARRLLKEILKFSMEDINSNLLDAASLKRVESMHVNSRPQEKGCISVPMKQGDWHCPKCDFLNFARNIKCKRCDGLFQEKLRQLQEDHDHLPLKKGDWICDKCNFLNFAKNTRCLQCKEKPAKRLLNPGEWECDSCNYINFRRNMVCLKCDYRRPKALNASTSSLESPDEDKVYKRNIKLGSSGVGFDNYDHLTQQSYRKNRHRKADAWQFVEDGHYADNSLKLRNEISRFMNFPVSGGKTDISKNVHKREQWKKEMLESGKGSMIAKENDDESSSADDWFMQGFSESNDDDEMEEWFGSGKRVR